MSQPKRCHVTSNGVTGPAIGVGYMHFATHGRAGAESGYIIHFLGRLTFPELGVQTIQSNDKKKGGKRCLLNLLPCSLTLPHSPSTLEHFLPLPRTSLQGIKRLREVSSLQTGLRGHTSFEILAG